MDQLVSYVKFSPIGIRAAVPGYGNCDYCLVDWKEFIANAGKSLGV